VNQKKLSHFSYNSLLPIMLLSFTYNLSCSKPNTEEALLVEAQSCLNQIPVSEPSGTTACLEKIQNLTSPASYRIRCSAHFIKQGFSDPNRIIQISEQLQESGGQGNSATLVAIGLLAFTGSEAKQEVAQALTSCEKAGAKGMTVLASMSNLATLMNSGSSGNIINECSNVSSNNTSGCADAIKDVLCETSDPEATRAFYTEMGTVAIVTYQSSCLVESEENPMCAVYGEVTQNGALTDPEIVGENLQKHLTANGQSHDLCASN
jgi:hypothetical protein